MHTIPVYNQEGARLEAISAEDDIFGGMVHYETLHSAVVMYEANKRVGTHKIKGKSEIAGPNIKPWRQKGTGRARQGSYKSAQFVGGGKSFGPKPRDYSYKYPKKIRHAALRSALFSKVIDGELAVIDSLKLDAPKTSVIANLVRTVDNDRRTPLREAFEKASTDSAVATGEKTIFEAMEGMFQNLENSGAFAMQRLLARVFYEHVDVLALLENYIEKNFRDAVSKSMRDVDLKNAFNWHAKHVAESLIEGKGTMVDVTYAQTDDTGTHEKTHRVYVKPAEVWTFAWQELARQIKKALGRDGTVLLVYKNSDKLEITETAVPRPSSHASKRVRQRHKARYGENPGPTRSEKRIRSAEDSALLKSVSNIDGVSICEVGDLNAYDVLKSRYVYFVKDAFEAARDRARAQVSKIRRRAAVESGAEGTDE
ncbi:MAG: 50S ribosomal protein L4 [Planctomycetes bacterium]|nr:50S ribosomal protein L4 [Planctomycetota bacterium]